MSQVSAKSDNHINHIKHFIGFMITASIGMAVSFVFGSCSRQEKFPTLTTEVAGPIDVVASDDAEQKYFYVLNSDYDRQYNAGSILVLGTDGTKLGAVQTPRMGRSLAIAGTDLLVLTNTPDDHGQPSVLLYSLAEDPIKPKLMKQWTPECEPLNAVMRKGYKYFAMTCIQGMLYIGTLTDDRTQSSLSKVREYGADRRAMVIDPKRQLLMMFFTDLGAQQYTDAEEDDVEAYDDTGNKTIVSNEIPDIFENSRQRRTNQAVREKYQFIVYNIGSEAANPGAPFPFRDARDPVLATERRWMYFNLANFDGTPDSDIGYTREGLKRKYYRTNFWDAKPDRFDPNSFYLSQRGRNETDRDLSHHGNNVVKVSIVADPVFAVGAPRKATTDSFRFERAYGFKGEVNDNGLQYPGAIALPVVQGKPMLIVNHVRDLFNWPRSQVYFAIAGKVLGDNYWYDELGSTSGYDSYFQLAVTDRGRGATCSFYGNSVILFDVAPEAVIKEFNRIN